MFFLVLPFDYYERYSFELPLYFDFKKNNLMLYFEEAENKIEESMWDNYDELFQECTYKTGFKI